MGFSGLGASVHIMFNLKKDSIDKCAPLIMYSPVGSEGLGVLGVQTGSWGKYMGPWGLSQSLFPHHFRLWREAQQPQIAPRRDAGRPGVSPWPRWADFAWNMSPCEQRLHPIPALPGAVSREVGDWSPGGRSQRRHG
jgi:hypothetical protein